MCEESRDAADKMAESRAAFARAAVARASAHVSRAEERVAILDRHGNHVNNNSLSIPCLSLEAAFLRSLLRGDDEIKHETKMITKMLSGVKLRAILDREASQAALEATQAAERAKVKFRNDNFFVCWNFLVLKNGKFGKGPFHIKSLFRNKNLEIFLSKVSIFTLEINF